MEEKVEEERGGWEERGREDGNRTEDWKRRKRKRRGRTEGKGEYSIDIIIIYNNI